MWPQVSEPSSDLARPASLLCDYLGVISTDIRGRTNADSDQYFSSKMMKTILSYDLNSDNGFYLTHYL